MDLVSNNCLVCYEWRLVLDFYRKYNEMIITKAVATKEEITIYLLTLFCAADTALGHVYTGLCLHNYTIFSIGGLVGTEGGTVQCSGTQLVIEKSPLH